MADETRTRFDLGSKKDKHFHVQIKEALFQCSIFLLGNPKIKFSMVKRRICSFFSAFVLWNPKKDCGGWGKYLAEYRIL